MRRPLMALCLTAVVGLATAPAALAAPTPVTPLAPTVIDECGVGGDRVVIPQVDGVRYLAEVSGTTFELTPGSYAGVAFWPEDAITEAEVEDLLLGESDWTAPDTTATITAEAVDDAVLADGATTSFDVRLSSAPCTDGPAAVTASATCGSVTFANPAGNPEAVVLWADADTEDDYTELPLAPGDSATITTDAAELDWFAVDAAEWVDEPWDEEDWMGEGDWAAPLAAADPDYVATEEDRELLVEVAEFIDDLLDEGLGGGYLELPSDCPAAPDTDGDPDGVAPEAPTTAPEVPAVVQTDGAALETPAPLAPVGLGLLAVGGLVGVLRRLARA